MWIIYALSASLLWGLTYVLSEQIYKKISVISSLGLTTFFASIFMLFIAQVTGVLKQDISTISGSQKLFQLVAAEVLVLLLAELFIGYSIAGKNATLAGLIEISYPIFIALFAYVLFKDSQANAGTFVGGLFIFTGVAIVYYFNR